jgi:regulator of cell morphogenesis and NO signaling
VLPNCNERLHPDIFECGERQLMKLLTPGMKMAEVIHSNYLLIPVVNRFGIRLGFGEKTVRAVCNDRRIDPEFFLTILNTFSNEGYFPQKTLQTFNVLAIVEYLKKTHSYYIETEIPIIESLINALLQRGQKRNRRLRLVKKFFLEYKKELFAHLKREETTTFPYIEDVHRRYRKKKSSESRPGKRYSMKVYEQEHDNVDDKLYDLKNILINYVKGEFDEGICSAIIFELFRLERDIKDHTRLEENILRPLVAEMEKALKSQAA